MLSKSIVIPEKHALIFIIVKMISNEVRKSSQKLSHEIMAVKPFTTHLSKKYSTIQDTPDI